MSLVCTLCKNHTNFQCFVRLYRDAYEELYKNKLFRDKIDFSYVHPICASFFPETEVVILKNNKKPSEADSNEKSIIAEPIICNFKAVNANSPNKCAICYCCTDSEVLIPCLFKGCCHKFHLQCIINRNDIGKIKLGKSDDTTFKYGIVCPEHIPGLNLQQNGVLETDSYVAFKHLADGQLQEELQGYEDMFAKVSTIIDSDPQLHQMFEAYANNKDTVVKKKKKSKKKIPTEKPESEPKPETPANPESDAKPPRGRPKSEKSREKKGLPTMGGLKKGKDGLFLLRFRPRQRPTENKDKKANKDNKDNEGENASKRDRSNSIAQTPEAAAKTPKPEIESAVRKKKDSLYNLRDEIKTTSRLKYDNFVSELATPSKSKTKTTANGETKLLSSEDKKKYFWNEINELHFRKPYTDEAELLMFSDLIDIPSEIKLEKDTPTIADMDEETKAQFEPNFEIPELKVFTGPDFVPTTFNPYDSLKVLFEFASNPGAPKKPLSFVGYFRMKKKAQTEMPIPENPEQINTSEDPKYCALSYRQHKELKELAQDNLRPYAFTSNYNAFRTKYKFQDQNVDYQDLSAEGYHKLFGLKHLEILGPEDTVNIKAKSMLSQELQEMQEQKDIENMGELSKEIIYFQYLLQHFFIQENNVRREKFTLKMKEDYAHPKTHKLQEKARKLESELKLTVTKKYFHEGFAERTTNIVTRTVVKNTSEQVVSQLTIVPKMDNDDEGDSRIIRISRQTKPTEIVETDCCICFANQFSEYNPIIYCSNCNSSFHKYCYGIAEIPSEDFYCDACLASNDPNMKKNKSLAQKLRKSSFRVQSNKDIKCGLCSVEEFPLRKFRKNDWFHITCLLLHDMVQFRNGEWLLKPEKMTHYELVKAENTQPECNICKSKIGLLDKCMGQGCTKHFHVLCAYLQGCEIDIIEREESKEDKTKNGLGAHIFCADHVRNPNRNVLQQQYFRRYTTNYKNSLSYETLEDYIKHLNEEEDTSQITTQVEDENYAEKREAEVATEDLEGQQFLGGLAKKTKVGCGFV